MRFCLYARHSASKAAGGPTLHQAYGGQLTMRDISFFVEVVTTGQFLGLNAASTPEEVTDTLGSFSENDLGDVMWRDYGAIEFFWERTSTHEPWQGTHLTIQVHRLDGYPEQMNAAVQRTYGQFRPTLRFAELRTELAETHCELVELPRRQQDDVREYANPRLGITILVVADGSHLSTAQGDVWSISCGNPIRRSGYPGPWVDDAGTKSN
jgi:hypothetical protein